jgi:alpha-1,2-mannosyltransferase
VKPYLTPNSISEPRRDRIWLLLCLLPAALIGTLYSWAVLVSTAVHPGWVGLNHIALGTDWMVFYGAIRSVLDGHLSLIMNGDDFTAYLNGAMADWLSVPLAFRPWFYPPTFLLFLLPFAPLGFTASYIAFQALTGGFLATALGKGAGNTAAAPYVAAGVLISPAASLNLIDGQCAFLVAALFVAGVRLLERRPTLAGVVLGLLTFKPQFCLLVPLALLGSRQWRSLVAAACSAVALAVVSAIIFGLDIWIWWIPRAIENLVSPDQKWAAYGRIWGHSVWACARLLGAPEKLASILQIAAMLASAIAVFVAFRSRLSRDQQLAVLLAATVLAAPHSGPYDATLLIAAAGIWLASNAAQPRFRDWILGLGIWMVPLLSPPVYVPIGRFAPLLTVALIGLILNELRLTKRPPNDDDRTTDVKIDAIPS